MLSHMLEKISSPHMLEKSQMVVNRTPARQTIHRDHVLKGLKGYYTDIVQLPRQASLFRPPRIAGFTV